MAGRSEGEKGKSPVETPQELCQPCPSSGRDETAERSGRAGGPVGGCPLHRGPLSTGTLLSVPRGVLPFAPPARGFAAPPVGERGVS